MSVLQRLPATLVNGLSIGLGLLLSTALIAWLWGLPAAIVASSGFGAVSVADNVSSPRSKPAAMLPAMLGAIGVTVLVALSRHHPAVRVAVVLGVTFVALLWTAWGKRGLPQSFAMILSLVFQMAAFSEAPMDARQAFTHVAWVAVGTLCMAVWAQLSATLLASRYRTLALADSLHNLSRLIRTQARWTQQRAEAALAPSDVSQADLLSLIGQQAALADVFQSARDLVYDQAEQAHSPERRRQIDALIQLINLRDVVLACQLDIEHLPQGPDTRQALLKLARDLAQQADRVSAWGQATRLGQAIAATPDNAPTAAAHPNQATALQSMARRTLHLRTQGQALGQALQGSPTGIHPESRQLLSLVSPWSWPLAPLRKQLNWRAPVCRYALRTTLAMACALALNPVLPWRSHPHWLLMTVAVVMRGNLEQTLARRDARIVGTALGCALASMLVWLQPQALWLFLVLALSLSMAHSFVQRDYRVTTAAGAVMALVQAHLFAHHAHPAWLDVAERLADTLIGALLAWGFSYVLPSWEKAQLPALVQRLRQALLAYGQQVLHWHEVHARTALRNHARREVYDTIWLLAQVLQRTVKEPAYARQATPQIEAMLVRSHRLMAQLAGVKVFLSRPHADWQDESVQAGLAQTEAALCERLGTAQRPPDADSPLDDPEVSVSHDLPSPHDDPRPWLLRRLRQIQAESAAWARAASAILSAPR